MRGSCRQGEIVTTREYHALPDGRATAPHIGRRGVGPQKRGAIPPTLETAPPLRGSKCFLVINQNAIAEHDAVGDQNTATQEIAVADENVIAHSFDHDIFFSGVPEYAPREDDVIVDVGAHIGTFTLLAAAKAPRGQVHAIEASRDSFNLLRINAALNRAANVHPHHLALADRSGAIELFHATGNWEHSLVKQMSQSSETVSSLTLTDFLTGQRIERCGANLFRFT